MQCSSCVRWDGSSASDRTDGWDGSASDRRESVSADVFLSRSHWPCEGASCARDGSRITDPTGVGLARFRVLTVVED